MYSLKNISNPIIKNDFAFYLEYSLCRRFWYYLKLGNWFHPLTFAFQLEKIFIQGIQISGIICSKNRYQKYVQVLNQFINMQQSTNCFSDTFFISDIFNAKENVNILFVTKYLLTRHYVILLLLQIFQCTWKPKQWQWHRKLQHKVFFYHFRSYI